MYRRFSALSVRGMYVAMTTFGEGGIVSALS